MAYTPRMMLARGLAQYAAIATLGLTTACIGDIIEKLTADFVEEHAPKGGSVEWKGGGSVPSPSATPTAKIAEASKTDQCRAELSAALATMREDQGLGMKVEDAHVEALLSEGVTSIAYARDGIRHIPSFRIAGSSGTCSLDFFKRATQKPGFSESTEANYGSVDLQVCACQ